jgi:hypothetical protein
LAIGEQHHQYRQLLALRVGWLLGQVIERQRQPIAVAPSGRSPSIARNTTA